MRQLVNKYQKSPSNIAEISAIEWAIPILEEYIFTTFGQLPVRTSWYKHEKRYIINKLWDRDGNICYLCEEIMKYNDVTIDHVIPLSKNGKDNMSNYKLAHPFCNLEKGNMLLEVYRDWKAGKREVAV